MSEKNRHNEQLEEIFKYLNDSMSNSERHDFEQELERDAFSYEAFEGLSTLKPAEIEKDLWSLDVIAGTKRKPRIWIKWVAIAAGVLILVFSSFYIYENIDHFKINITQKDQETPPEQLNEPLTFKKESMKSETVDSVGIMLTDAGLNVKTAEGLIDSKGLINEAKTAISKGAKAGDKIKNLNQGSNDTNVFATSSTQTEEKDISSENKTDDNTTSPEIKEETPKYSPEETAAKEEALKRPGINAEPQPLGGSAMFKQYIEQNTNYPEEVEKKEKVTVKVTFAISKTGNPTNIRVERSPSEEFAKEAIRIIDTGPRWSPKIRDGIPVEGEMSVRITFKPKK